MNKLIPILLTIVIVAIGLALAWMTYQGAGVDRPPDPESARTSGVSPSGNDQSYADTYDDQQGDQTSGTSSDHEPLSAERSAADLYEIAIGTAIEDAADGSESDTRALIRARRTAARELGLHPEGDPFIVQLLGGASFVPETDSSDDREVYNLDVGVLITVLTNIREDSSDEALRAVVDRLDDERIFVNPLIEEPGFGERAQGPGNNDERQGGQDDNSGRRGGAGERSSRDSGGAGSSGNSEGLYLAKESSPVREMARRALRIALGVDHTYDPDAWREAIEQR